MSLKSFLTVHRRELLRACEDELNAGWTIEQLGRDFSELLRDLQRDRERDEKPEPQSLLGSHPNLARARLQIDQLARRSRTPVLLVGELGTGRRRGARALHAATYPDGELFELNGPEQLGELEQRIARLRTRTSAEAASGLTVYVHDLPEAGAEVQTHVAHLLREQALQLRVVVSATCSLTQSCREGSLRSDLVFGFPTIIELPPLRERASDIPELISHFIDRHAIGDAPEFAPSALVALQKHPWPGNLSELEHLVQRVCNAAGPNPIEAEQLRELDERPSSVRFNLPATGVDMSEIERDLLVQALALAQNNQSKAARLLGITRDQIRYRLAKFDLLQQSER